MASLAGVTLGFTLAGGGGGGGGGVTLIRKEKWCVNPL